MRRRSMELVKILPETVKSVKLPALREAGLRGKKGGFYDAAVVLDDTGGKYVNFKLEFDRKK